MAKVAIVTGANKGIGFAIVKGLCERWDGDVYLTARDESRGRAAVAELEKLGLKPIYHRLDVTDSESVDELKRHVDAKYGKIDLLINNAAIAYKNDARDPFAEQAERTTFVNYFSTLAACKTLFPLLAAGSRVVNVSSSAGHLSRIPSAELRKRFADGDLTEEKLSRLVREFVDSAKSGKNAQGGWGSSAYVVSKVALTAMTIMHAREYGPKGIYVNCCHPGYVDTDMTSHKGHLTIEQGARAPLLLAIGEKEKEYRGVYMWHDGSLVDWYADSL